MLSSEQARSGHPSWCVRQAAEMMHMGPMTFEADDPTKKTLGYPGSTPQQPQPLPPPQQPPPMLITTSSPLTVRLTDLVPRDGLPHDTYRVALGSLMTSLARFNTGGWPSLFSPSRMPAACMWHTRKDNLFIPTSPLAFPSKFVFFLSSCYPVVTCSSFHFYRNLL